MKPRGRHPERRLTAVAVKNAKPGRRADGGGLYLVVDPSGAKRWVLRTTVAGRRVDMGLGSASLVSLAEAREQALALRKVARSGGDPLATRRQERVVVPTFEQAARHVYESHKATWRNKEHARQWLASLEAHAFPSIGRLPVDQVGTAEVLRCLSPIWLTTHETARRLRQRIGVVLDWATAAGHRSAENPVRTISRALPRLPKVADAHHGAMPWADVPQFVRRLRNHDETAELIRLALEFAILTASRAGETLGAAWTEFGEDESGVLWVIPASRTKSNRPHRVPLPPRCLEILSRARELGSGSTLVFPGRSRGASLSDSSLLKTVKRLIAESAVETSGVRRESPQFRDAVSVRPSTDLTVHGFRASFRDWAAEKTSFANDVAEAALSHALRNRTEASYKRTDHLDRRRELMARWADFVCGGAGEVVQLRVAK